MDSTHLVEIMNRCELTDVTLAHALGVAPRTVKAWRLEQRPLLGPAARLLYVIRRYPGILKELSELVDLPVDNGSLGDHI